MKNGIISMLHPTSAA